MEDISEVLFKVMSEDGDVLFATTDQERAFELAADTARCDCVISYIDNGDNTLTWRHVYDPRTGELWYTQSTRRESDRYLGK
jgi:hypothetical protein